MPGIHLRHHGVCWWTHHRSGDRASSMSALRNMWVCEFVRDEQWWTQIIIIRKSLVTFFAIACSPCLFFMTTWLWPAGMVFWCFLVAMCSLSFAQVLHFSLFHPHSWVGLCLQVWHGRQHHPGSPGRRGVVPIFFKVSSPWISGSNDFDWKIMEVMVTASWTPELCW